VRVCVVCIVYGMRVCGVLAWKPGKGITIEM